VTDLDFGTPTGILDATADDYHADNVADRLTLSASIAHTLCTKSPAHAKAEHPRLNPNWQRKEEERFDVGNACHSLLLQGIENVHIVHADSWRTKVAKEERDEARSYGRVPLLASQWDEVRRICDAFREQLPSFGLTPEPLTDGAAEQTLVWEEDGVLCRARVDWLHSDHRTVRDIKTTSKSAEPGSWSRTLFSIGADIQQAFYSRGIQAVFGTFAVDWTFLVIETTPPYAMSAVSLAPDALAFANSKVDYALAVWKRCLELDRWDSYPTEIAFAEAPSYEVMRWLEREAQAAA